MGDVANWFAGVSGRQVVVRARPAHPARARRAAGRRRARPRRHHRAGRRAQPARRAEPARHHRRCRRRRGRSRSCSSPARASGWCPSPPAVGALSTSRWSTRWPTGAGSAPTGWCSSASASRPAATSLITLIVVLTNPWNTTMALTWLSGSTYGRTAAQVWPVAVALLVMVPLVVRWRRDLDVLAVDDDVARVLGVQLERTRLGPARRHRAAHRGGGHRDRRRRVRRPRRAARGPLARRRRRTPGSSRSRRCSARCWSASRTPSAGRSSRPPRSPPDCSRRMIGTPYFIYLLWRTRRSAL